MEIFISAVLLYCAIEEASVRYCAIKEKELEAKYPNYKAKNRKSWFQFW
ncbi:MAG: hypothetical protein IMZ53_01895 [Thermoplasmata archaeon]|nr:hypothetical protein [Thermoplasmata archaeon]